MTAIEIDETTRNAILAALDERAGTLEYRVKLWQGVIDQTHPNHLPSDDAQRALVWNTAALHETNMARLLVAEAGEPEADLPVCPCDHAHALCLPSCHFETLAEAIPWQPAKKVAAPTESELAGMAGR